jgi:hydroxymethylglutaryl-CoA lyase
VNRLPPHVQITEVGMRDGFQMESIVLATSRKIEVGQDLIAAGLRHLEVTSFVSPTAVPQLADAARVVEALRGHGAKLHALVPNVNGARRAVAAGADRITVFVSASEAHNLRNVRRSVEESLAAVKEIAAIVLGGGRELGGAVSTAFGCPYQGNVPLAAVARVVDAYVESGVAEITLGDTTGMATPPIVESVVNGLADKFPETHLALHFHNTRGLGLVNVMRGLELGISRYEASVGGLGGCPFAVGATGNVCTEDLVNMLHELGIKTGIDLNRVIRIAHDLEKDFHRSLPGQVMRSGPRTG